MMASFIFADDIDAWNNFVLQIIWAERSDFEMTVAHKGSISMGMVLIPIGLYKTTVDNDIHFNQLEKESKARIKYKKYCSHCGKEVKPEDIVKGYEFSKDQKNWKRLRPKRIRPFTFCSLPKCQRST